MNCYWNILLKDVSPPGPIGRGPGLWTLYKIEVSPVYFYVTSIIYYSSTDWLVQLDDSLPILLDKPIFIPKHVYHRTIKGTGSLLVKIKKYD